MKNKGIIILGLSCLFLGGCSSKEASYSLSVGDGWGNNTVVTNTTQKITYSVEYTISGDKAFQCKEEIEGYVDTYNGKITSSRISEKSANVIYKIPTDKLNEFLDHVDSYEGVSNKSITTKDITQDYAYSEARITALTAQRQSYMDILATLNTKDDLANITTIYDKIAQIDEELLKITNTKTYYDDMLDYSTVEIYYYNYTYHEKTFFEEYFEYVGEFFVGLFEGILYFLPVGLVGFGIFSAIFFPIRAKHKKELAKRKEELENKK